MRARSRNVHDKENGVGSCRDKVCLLGDGVRM